MNPRQLLFVAALLGAIGVIAAERAANAQETPAETKTDTPTAESQVKDGFRLRGGFSINGGVGFGDNVSGAVFGLAGRLGLQFNHYFGIYYQNTPMVTLLAANDGSGVGAGFIDYNSGIANLTLFHMLEIGAGPSGDFVSVAACDTNSIQCESASTFAFGVHGRLALEIGGLSGNGPRRSGFSLGADVHPIFLPGSTLVTLTGGLGGEWY